MENIHGIIYGYECQINGKWYVGQTTEARSKRREAEHKGCYGRATLFQRAVSKHGWGSFVKYILEDGVPDRDTLCLLEQFWIESLQSYGNNGYNLTSGGEKNKTFIVSADVREQISKSLTGKVVSQETRDRLRVAQTGKKYSKELCERISIAKKGQLHTEDTKRRIRETLKKNCKLNREIICVETGEEYHSLQEARAAGYLNVSRALIRGLTCGGYHWIYK